MTVRPDGFILVALALVAACAQPPATPTAVTQADTAAVNNVREQEVTAIATGDTTMPYAADDIVLLPPNESAVVGLAAARAWFGAFAGQYRASVVYTDTRVQFAGDLAVEQYAGTLTLTPVAGGEPMNEVLKGLHVYRRDAGGVWKMVQDIWNSDTPSAPGQ
jgi:ketosteroid isomerase-like protein